MSAADRSRIERIIEALIALLDYLDGDPELEPSDNGIADLDSLSRVEFPQRWMAAA